MKALYIVLCAFLISCGESSQAPAAAPEAAAAPAAKVQVAKAPEVETSKIVETPVIVSGPAKLTAEDCIDPRLDEVKSGTVLMLCDGTVATGTLAIAAVPDLTNLTAENVRSGIIVSNVTGTYAAVAPVADPSPDLTNLTASNVKLGVIINNVTGTVVVESHSSCTSNNQQGCVATSTWRSADLTNLSAANVKSGVVLAGVTGTVSVESHSSCTDNYQQGCIATDTYRSANLTNLSAGNVKKDVVIAGTSGTYEGSAPAATDLRYNVSLNGTVGRLKTNCRNALGWYDYLNDGNMDWWDSIDDRQKSGQTLPRSWAIGQSGYMLCNDYEWETTAEGHLRDKVTATTWHYMSSTATWSAAVTACANLNENGATWRLPTQKELMIAYAHGLGFAYQTVNAAWSSTTYSQDTNSAWITVPASGDTRPDAKTNPRYYMCVHD